MSTKKISGPIELIKKSVDLFSKKENFLFLVKVYSPTAISSLIFIILSYLSAYVYKDSVFLSSVSIVLRIVAIFVETFVAVAGIVAIGKIVNGGGKFSVRETFKIVRKKYWKYFLLSVILGLITVGGLILLIIPGILFVVWFAFSKFIMIEKKVGIKESLVKSKILAKGIYWKILGRLTVFGLFAIFVQMVLGFVPYFGSIAISLCGGLFILPTYLLYKEISE